MGSRVSRIWVLGWVEYFWVMRHGHQTTTPVASYCSDEPARSQQDEVVSRSPGGVPRENTLTVKSMDRIGCVLG